MDIGPLTLEQQLSLASLPLRVFNSFFEGIDCSNRGICDYTKGTCSCFSGSWGDACENKIGTGSSFNNLS